MIVIFGEIIPQVRKDHYQEALKESLTDAFLTPSICVHDRVSACGTVFKSAELVLLSCSP